MGVFSTTAFVKPRGDAAATERVADLGRPAPAPGQAAAAGSAGGALALLRTRDGDVVVMPRGGALVAYNVRTGASVAPPALASGTDGLVGVSLGDRHVLVSDTSGLVRKLSRGATGAGATLDAWRGLSAPRDAVELSDGRIVVAESGSGRLALLSSQGVVGVLAEGLSEPTGIVADGRGLYVTEAGAGRVVRLDPVTGQRVVVAQGLSRPEGIARTVSGRLIIAEAGTDRIVEVTPATGAVATLATDTRFGRADRPGFAGVAVASDGAIFFVSETDAVLYRLTPR